MLNIKIDSKLRELEELREMATSIGGMNTDGKVQTSTSDRISNAVVKIISMENEINDDIDRLVDMKRKIEKELDKIENSKYYEVLHRRYILCQKWERIAVDMNYDLRWVLRLHGRALEELRKGK